MKKVLSLVLALSMALGSFGMAFADAPALSDVEGHENQEAIERLNDLEIVEGYEDGTVNPDGEITRAEFAVLLVRALGLENSADAAKGDTQFTDVTVEAGYEWASGAINVASRLGYIEGHGNGMFGPAEKITYEQAVTMIVRALGYKPAAEDKGGYPIGYLVVAEQDLDLDDNVTAFQGVASTRGAVFQLLDNALTVDMMEQVGYGDDKEYKVKEGKTLLGQLGYDRIDEDNRVVDFDADDLTIELADGEEYEVEEGFDFAEAHGLEIILWVDGDEVVTYELDEEALYDAVEVTKEISRNDDGEIELIDAEDEYELTDDTIVFINGSEEDVEDLKEDVVYEYGKVVEDKGEVVFISVYNLEDFIVVEEVEDNMIYQHDESDDLDVEDFTIVKDGKTISVDELEENDVVFYNYDEEYAEVYNNANEGEIERIYEGEVKIEGDRYEFNTDFDAKYLDAGEFDNLDEEILNDMEEEDAAVEFFLSRTGELVFVLGSRAETATNSYYRLVVEDTKSYKTRGDDYFTLDLLNEDEKVVEYDIEKADAEDYIKGMAVDKDGNQITNWENTVKEGLVLEVEIDEDGDIEDIVELKADAIKAKTKIELDEKYAQGSRLQNSTLIFWKDGEDDFEDYTVLTLEEALEEFEEVTAGTIYVNEDGRVAAIVAENTDAEKETYRGMVTKVRTLRSSDEWEITIEVEGEKVVYVTDDNKADVLKGKVDVEDKIVKIEVRNELITAIDVLPGEEVEVKDTNRSNNTITDKDGTEYELTSEGVVYDATDDYDEIRFREIDVKDDVVIYLVDDSSRFVDYIVVGGSAADKAADIKGVEVDSKASDAKLTKATSDANWGRTVTATVYADVDWDIELDITDYDVTVATGEVTASGVDARSISHENYDGNNITFTIVFNEDVYVGDTLEVADEAIVVTAKNAKGEDLQKATIKGVELGIK